MKLQNSNNQSLGSQNLISQINKFANDLHNTGKDPQQILDELIKSGQYSQEQINKAKSMAQMTLGLFGK